VNPSAQVMVRRLVGLAELLGAAVGWLFTLLSLPFCLPSGSVHLLRSSPETLDAPRAFGIQSAGLSSAPLNVPLPELTLISMRVSSMGPTI